MKKYIVIGFLAVILMMPLAGSADIINEEKSKQTILKEDFTHAVFAEYGTTTTCPHCPPASEALFSIYESDDYPFYFASFVADQNINAARRLTRLKTIAVPTVYFDGGDVNEVGNVGESVYRTIIQDMGEREVNQPIDMNTSVTWDGNAKITVSVTLKNNGGFYFGILKSYVTEIESRWNNIDGDPYHFGFLDFAFNRLIILLPGAERTFTKSWDGTKNHGGITFEDITEDNIMVFSTVSHWIPQKRTGYEESEYYAFIVDQSSGAVPS